MQIVKRASPPLLGPCIASPVSRSGEFGQSLLPLSDRTLGGGREGARRGRMCCRVSISYHIVATRCKHHSCAFDLSNQAASSGQADGVSVVQTSSINIHLPKVGNRHCHGNRGVIIDDSTAVRQDRDIARLTLAGPTACPPA